MPRPKNPLPTYRFHKSSGQAICTVRLPDGRRKDVLLGRYDSHESKAEYEHILAQLRSVPGVIIAGLDDPAEMSVNELVLAFWQHAEQHYRHPDGRPTSELHNYRLALKHFRESYGHSPAREFGPRALKTVRDKMISAGWCRLAINGRVGRIKRLFKWAASEELVPVAVYQALATVAGLQAGQSGAVESSPIGPADAQAIDAVLPYVSRHVQGLIQFQRNRPVNRRLAWSGTLWVFLIGENPSCDHAIPNASGPGGIGSTSGSDPVSPSTRSAAITT